MPITHISLFLVMAMSLRMVTYSELGPAGYAQRMNDLVNGSALEQVAGQFMAMDSVSESLARTARGIVRSIGI